jgi:unsaturated rhamnogalacturonyl hydrolase
MSLPLPDGLNNFMKNLKKTILKLISLKFWFVSILSFCLIIIQVVLLYGQTATSNSSADKIPTVFDKDPIAIGRKIVRNVTERNSGWRYPKICSYYGGLIFADAIGDSLIRIQLQKKFEPWLKGKHKIHSGHVDYNVFGIWPFEIYRQTGDKKFLSIAKKLADDEYKTNRKDGLATYTRFWVDDMYMVGSLQAQAYKSLKDTIYLYRAARQLINYCERLQKPNGLFFHREDAPWYWGRGNGWGAAAMAEVLLNLPEENKYYSQLLNAYQKMMKSLLEFQGQDGMWHQLLDDPESFEESSCTGMFLFAMATGLKKGWLQTNDYASSVQKGWEALAGYVNDRGEVREVCVGTNAGNKKKHYLTRPRSTGNFHGQAAVLWAATAMVHLRKEKP